MYLNNNQNIKKIMLKNKSNPKKKKEFKTTSASQDYKSYIKDYYLINVGLSNNQLIDFGDGRSSLEINLTGKYDKSFVNEEYIVTNFWNKDILSIHNFSTRKVARKKIVLFYIEWDEWSEEKTKLFINKSLMKYLKEKNIINIFDIIDTPNNRKSKKPIDFVDFFNWLAPRIKHEIRIKNITLNNDSKYMFSFPYHD